MPKGIYKRIKPTWSKGTKGIVKPNSGSFKKGHKIGFKKGYMPWNKGKTRKEDQRIPQSWLGKRREEICGKKNPNWSGGFSKLDKLIRRLPEYFLWRSRVFERDNWTCQTCQKRGVYLEAHHKKEFIKIIRENNIKSTREAIKCKEFWDIGNGVALCKDCHNLTKRGKGT